MTLIPYKVRFSHGEKIENDFIDYINSRSLWVAHTYGQRQFDPGVKNDLRNISLPVKGDYAQSMIQRLPETWRHIYQRGLANGFPSLCRWDADAFCVYNNKPQFFAEIKSSITRSNNVAIEITCYLAALVNQDRLGLPLHFVFSPNESNQSWTYLTLDEIAMSVSRVFDGRNTSGSSTPFALIPKEALIKPIDGLLVQCADQWPL